MLTLHFEHSPPTVSPNPLTVSASGHWELCHFDGYATPPASLPPNVIGIVEKEKGDRSHAGLGSHRQQEQTVGQDSLCLNKLVKTLKENGEREKNQ